MHSESAHRPRATTRSVLRGARPLALAAALLATACGDSQSQTQAAAAETDTALALAPILYDASSLESDDDPVSGEEASDHELEVTVAGGRWAGTYRYRGDMDCGFTPEFGTWSVQMSNDLPRTVSEMSITAASLAHGGGQTDVGTFDMIFGRYEDPDQVTFHASTEDGIGKGVHFDVERQGTRALIRASGTDDATGVRFTATIRCATVNTYR